jgi:hypothetical protein
MTDTASPLDLNTLWVECKNADGRVRSDSIRRRSMYSIVIIQVYFYNAKTRQSSWTKPEGQRVISQSELDQLLVKQNDDSSSTVSPTLNESVSVNNEASSDIVTANVEKTSGTVNACNPYSYPPPALGMPLGAIPPHLMPHMAQMMQSGVSHHEHR